MFTGSAVSASSAFDPSKRQRTTRLTAMNNDAVFTLFCHNSLRGTSY